MMSKRLRRSGGKRSSSRLSGDASRRAQPRQRAENPRVFLSGGFADRSRVTLRYTSRLTMTSTTGLPNTYAYSGNNVYDPDVTGTGAQPNSFDVWASVYNRYKVHGSRAKLQMISAGTTSILLTSFGARESFGSGSVADDASRPRHEVRWTNGGDTISKYDMAYSTQAVLGLTNAQYQGNEDITALVSTSPLHQWYWGVRVESWDQSTTATLYAFITIDYDVEFYDRKDRTLELSEKKSPPAPPASKDALPLEKKASTAASLPKEQEYEFVELRKVLRAPLSRPPGAGGS